MAFTKEDISVKRVDNDSWELLDDLVYTGKYETFTVPKGFQTDFATVPRVALWLVPKTGAYTPAVILHDYFCEALGRVREGYLDAPPVTSRDADGIMRRVMRELGVPTAKRWLMWVGVRWGALMNPSRRKGLLQDLPMMLVLTLLYLPVVLPAMGGIGICMLIYKLYELIGGK